MATTELTMTRAADRKRLNDLLDRIRRTNRVFTIEFVKQNGEPRIINGIAKNYRRLKGTGTTNMTAVSKRQKFNIFQCYEVQVAVAERLLAERMCAEPKTKGFKNIQIENIERIRFGGDDYVISGNKYVLNPKAVAEYMRRIRDNREKVAALEARTKS